MCNNTTSPRLLSAAGEDYFLPHATVSKSLSESERSARVACLLAAHRSEGSWGATQRVASRTARVACLARRASMQRAASSAMRMREGMLQYVIVVAARRELLISTVQVYNRT